MILTVTLNTAVDKTYAVENFRIDRVHRPSSWKIVAGGKGINVARVYTELGGESVATGFVGGHNGDFILESLRLEGLRSDFVRTDGESRVCIAIVDPVQKTQTELNEVGPEVSTDEIDRLKIKFESLIRGMEYAVVSGSCPPGVPDDIYRELIELASKYDVPCVLDANGGPLTEGLKAVPFMAKPNIHELSAVVGRPLATIEEAAEAGLDLVKSGIKIVVVTLGRDGAIVCTNDEVLRATSPEIHFVSAVGSGDSFAAAFIHTIAGGGTVAEALRMGTAAGAANATYSGAGFCKKEDVLDLANKVEIGRLEI